MSLLCVRVKKAKLHGPPDKFNAYVTLKVQNVKSTTIAVRGDRPCWEQDFMFEINHLDSGLVVELWNKGLIWDTMIGTALIPLDSIQQSDEEGPGQWTPLDSEVLMKEDQICGTTNPTSHRVLLDTRFELPFEIPENEAQYWTRKLERVNGSMSEQSSFSNEMQRRRLPPQCSLEDGDSVIDERFGEIGHRPPPFYNTSQPNSSAHQYPIGRRGRDRGVCSPQSPEQETYSPPDSSHRDSSGNLSPTSSQPSSELQGVQRVEPRPPRGNDSWNEDDVEKEVHAPPEPGSNKDLQENLSVASADICEEKRPPISSEATPPPCSPSRVRWLKAYNKVREKLLQSPHLQGDPNKQPWAKPGGNAPFGIDSMPDLRRRRPISLVGELVSAAAKTLPTWFPADLW
ncbi:protein unc-13 homolog B-like isoform X3 [Oryzias latipes]